MYTQSQLREALGLSKETFRYWKSELPPLSPESSSRTCFRSSDLLATGIVKAVTQLGVPVGRLRSMSAALFGECRSSSWLALESQVAVFDLDANSMRFCLPPISEVHGPTVVIPLAPIVECLREHLLSDDVNPQRNLAFPPLSIVGGNKS